MHASAPDLNVSRWKGCLYACLDRGLLVRPCAALHLVIRDSMELDGRKLNLMGFGVGKWVGYYRILHFRGAEYYIW